MKLYLMNLLDMSTGTAWEVSKAMGNLLYIGDDEINKYGLSNLEYITDEKLEQIKIDKPEILVKNESGEYKINNHWHKNRMPK